MKHIPEGDMKNSAQKARLCLGHPTPYELLKVIGSDPILCASTAEINACSDRAVMDSVQDVVGGGVENFCD